MFFVPYVVWADKLGRSSVNVIRWLNDETVFTLGSAKIFIFP